MLGISSENLQANLIFKPEPFVNGTCRLYVEGIGVIEMNKQEDCYTLPIKSSLLKAPYIDICFKIIQPANEEGTPIFVTKIIHLKVLDTIEDDAAIPEQYPTWIETFDSKIVEIDSKLSSLDGIEEELEEAEIERNTRVENAVSQIEDLTSAYNTNATNKTNAFNANAINKTTAFDQHYASKVIEIDGEIVSAKNELDGYTEGKKDEIDGCIDGLKVELDDYETAKEGELDTYTNTKKTELNTHTNTKKSELDEYEGTKETALNTLAGNLTSSFNNNAGSKTSDFNDNVETKTTAFNTNATNKTTAFNENAIEKTGDFNTNSTSKTTAYDENASTKLEAYNTNHATKLAEYNTNATEKTSEFDQNANDKTDDFDDNASAKTLDFNNNAIVKTNEYNANADEVLQTNEELRAIIESELDDNTVEGTNLDVSDSAEYRGKIAVKGNTYQKSRVLPEGYTQVDYIESHGKEYIDTGVNADSNLRTILDVAYTNPTGSNQNIGAIRIANGGNTTMRYHLLPQNEMFRIYAHIWSTALIDIDTNRHYYDLDIPNNKAYVDGEEFTTRNVNPFDVGLNFYLFARSSDTEIYFSNIKLYESKMYYNSNLIRHFIPCYRNSDNEVGLYDLVNNAFYANNGTGAFTYGSVVDIPNPEYPQEIKVVTGDNVIKHRGKNMFDVDSLSFKNGYYDATGAYKTGNNNGIFEFIKVLQNSDYTLSVNKAFKFIAINEFDENKNFIKRTQIQQGRISTISTDVNTVYLAISFNLDSTTTITKLLLKDFEPQLEEGSTPTPYEPYKEKDYNLNLGTIELCKIDNSEDFIFKNTIDSENYDSTLVENGWYKYGNIRKYIGAVSVNYTNRRVILKGRSTLNMETTTNVRAYGVANMSSSIIQNLRYNYGWAGLAFQLSELEFNMIGATNSEEFKKWCDENLIAYATINSDYDDIDITPITDPTLISQLEALNKAGWFKGTNHIWTATDNLEPNLKGTYKQSNNLRLQALEQAVVALGGV